jgi:hypothetical protein
MSAAPVPTLFSKVTTAASLSRATSRLVHRSPLSPQILRPHCVRTVFTRSLPRYAEAASSSTPGATPTPSPSPSETSRPPSLENLQDKPIKLQEDDPSNVDWTSSFHGLSIQPFSKEAAEVLLAPLDDADIEIKPDGIIYLPEIKYRRILNKAFGPGGWGLAPRGETIVTPKAVTREYALLAHGR